MFSQRDMKPNIELVILGMQSSTRVRFCNFSCWNISPVPDKMISKKSDNILGSKKTSGKKQKGNIIM